MSCHHNVPTKTITHTSGEAQDSDNIRSWYNASHYSTIPSNPLVSAPLRTESDISVTAANSTFDPAVLSCKKHHMFRNPVSTEEMTSSIWKDV